MVQQVRIKTLQPDGTYRYSGWVDMVSCEQFDYLEDSLLRWRKRGWTCEYISYQWRKKPNIFTRIKEWWNNE